MRTWTKSEFGVFRDGLVQILVEARLSGLTPVVPAYSLRLADLDGEDLGRRVKNILRTRLPVLRPLFKVSDGETGPAASALQCLLAEKHLERILLQRLNAEKRAGRRAQRFRSTAGMTAADRAEIPDYRAWKAETKQLVFRVSGELEALLLSYEAAIAADLEADNEARRQAYATQGLLLTPAPPALPYGVSFRGAELLARDWLRHLGIASADVTPAGVDGGIDVTSETHLGQVKHYSGNVGAPSLRDLYGVAMAAHKKPVFFTSAGYTRDALTFAEATEMPLFIYSAEDGTLVGGNTRGGAIRDEGFPLEEVFPEDAAAL